MALHPVTGKIIALLKTHDIWFETFEHAPVTTSEEAAKTRPGYTLHHGVKAMVVRIKKSAADTQFVMLAFPADLKFSNRKVKDVTGAKDIRFATVEEIFRLTGGVQTGAVPPFGNLFQLPVIADAKLFENVKIVFNAGDRSFSLAMKSADYKALQTPQIADITA